MQDGGGASGAHAVLSLFVLRTSLLHPRTETLLAGQRRRHGARPQGVRETVNTGGVASGDFDFEGLEWRLCFVSVWIGFYRYNGRENELCKVIGMAMAML